MWILLANTLEKNQENKGQAKGRLQIVTRNTGPAPWDTATGRGYIAMGPS